MIRMMIRMIRMMIRMIRMMIRRMMSAAATAIAVAVVEVEMNSRTALCCEPTPSTIITSTWNFPDRILDSDWLAKPSIALVAFFLYFSSSLVQVLGPLLMMTYR